MTQAGHDELVELATTLETCMERMNAIQKDLGLISTLVAMVAVNLRRHHGASTTDSALKDLLASHHERLAETISVSLRSDRKEEAEFGLQLEPADHSLRAGTQRVPLTESEYRVLELLMQKTPEPVSRQNLLDHLYGAGDQPTHAVLDMFIYRIRQKLKTAGVAPTIKSVRGAGWVLTQDAIAAAAGSPRPMPIRSEVG